MSETLNHSENGGKKTGNEDGEQKMKTKNIVCGVFVCGGGRGGRNAR